MGDSRHPLGPRLGRLLFIWNQGSEYGNMIRGWIGPISLATGVAKYMGLSASASLTVGAGLVVVITALIFWAGWYHVHVDGARNRAQQEIDNDPWRCYVVTVLGKIEARLDGMPFSG